jgi:transposase InsO family protein
MVAAILSQGNYWPGMKDDAQRLVSGCMPCQRFNYHKAAFHPYRCPEAPSPMDHLVLDLIGEFPASGGYSYVLVVTDVASRFVWLRPLREKSAVAVSEAIMHIMVDFGWPRVLGSDQGKEFANSVMRAVMTLLRVDQRLSSPYHPRGNGIAERHVQSALQAMRKAIDGDEGSWVEHLPAIQFAQNCRVSDTHGCSPFSVMFGRHPVGLTDHSSAPDSEALSPEQGADRFRTISGIIHPTAASQGAQSALRRKAAFDKAHASQIRKDPFPVGSLVMVWNHRKTGKLEARYEGPYTVVKRSTGGAYTLQDSTGALLSRNVPPSHLKLVSSDIPFGDSLEVDSILDYKGPPHQRRYKVRWVGMPPSEDSWEPVSQFDDVAVIAAYWRRRGVAPASADKVLVKRSLRV